MGIMVKSILLGGDEGEFFQGFFYGGLVVVEVTLGSAEALDASNRLGVGGGLV